MTFAPTASPRTAGIQALLLCALAPFAGVPEASILDLFSASARNQLAKGRAVTELLEEEHIDIAIAAAVRSNVDAGRFVARFREVEQLLKGSFVDANGRFSPQARLEDLEALTLDDDDLDDLRGCRPGRCGVKLSSAEITRIQSAVRGAGERWKPAVLAAFKGALVERVLAYRSKGIAGLAPYEDGTETTQPRFVTGVMLEIFEQRGLGRREALAYLRGYPAEAFEADSFLYWSKDRLSDAKPVVSITHAVIVRGSASDPPVALMTQVYASHYLNASMSLTTLVPEPADAPSLAYLRLSTVDVFDGRFGGIVRRLVQRRIRSDGPRAIDALRRKLEAPDR